MDINQLLNEIIFQYDLDQCYPGYKKRLWADRYVRQWMRKTAETGKHILCIANNMDDIKYFSLISDRMHCHADFVKFTEKKMAKEDFAQYDEIYCISVWEGDIVRYCADKNIKCRNLYTELQKQGLFFEQACYRFLDAGKHSFSRTQSFSYLEGLQVEYWLQKKELQWDESEEEKLFHLRKMFFLMICMRDFIGAEQCAGRIEKIARTDNCVKAWKQIQELLTLIRKKLKERSQKDIIVFWLDDLGYYDAQGMPFLDEFRQKGIDFNNAFTCMSYTQDTCRTLFCGARPLEDKAYSIKRISRENSPLIEKLCSGGYDINICTGDHFFDIFPADYRTEETRDASDAGSVLMWDMINAALNAEQPIFGICHIGIEGHPPYFYSDMEDNDFIDLAVRNSHARTALDKQLRYYVEMFHENSVKILMSDHGNGLNPFMRSHAILSIRHKNISPRCITGMFPYENFTELILQLLDGGEIDESITKDYAKIENYDRYNGKEIAEIVSKKLPISLMWQSGYQGIATTDEYYIKFNTGDEFILDRNNELSTTQVAFALDINRSSLDRLQYFRGLLYDATDLYSESSALKYTKYISQIFKNHRKMPERKNEVIQQFFSQFEDNSVALRMGGEFAVSLYSLLSDENRKKIHCIIDQNKECYASVLGYPVYSLTEMDFTEIKYVVACSYQHRETLKRESQMYSDCVKMADIYEFLEQKGYVGLHTLNGYEFPPRECYDVDFPFGDLKEDY